MEILTFFFLDFNILSYSQWIWHKNFIEKFFLWFNIMIVHDKWWFLSSTIKPSLKLQVKLNQK